MLPVRRILAPIDFSSYSGASLAFAARLAHQCGAELHVLHVEPPLLDAVAHSQHLDLDGEARAAMTAFAKDVCPPNEVVPKYHVAAGGAADAICATASTCHADLVVIGPRGRSPLAATLLGSTTRGVLSHSPCPVAVVPGTWAPVAEGGQAADAG
jgi:nucleotide-binding universal stress UspA family protein